LGKKVEEQIKDKKLINQKEEIYEVKLVMARYKNLHLKNPETGEKIAIRRAGEMLFILPLVQLVEEEGESYYQNYADPRGGVWQDTVWETKLSKQEILDNVLKPKKKSKNFQKLLNFLGVTELR